MSDVKDRENFFTWLSRAKLTRKIVLLGECSRGVSTTVTTSAA